MVNGHWLMPATNYSPDGINSAGWPTREYLSICPVYSHPIYHPIPSCAHFTLGRLYEGSQWLSFPLNALAPMHSPSYNLTPVSHCVYTSVGEK